MSDIIYGSELLTQDGPDLDYEATMLMVSGFPHKIFITPEQRDDILEGYGHGFVIEINSKRIGCYWKYKNTFEFDENDVKTWNLDEIGIAPDMSSTNQFTNCQFFSSNAELSEAIEFIKRVFSEYDGADTSAIVDDEVVMLWNKKFECKLRMTDALLSRIESGDLVRDNENG